MKFHALALAALTSLTGLTAAADIVSFVGTLTRSNPPSGPGGRCAPAFTIVNDPILYTSTGTSNLGSFLNTASACMVPPPPTVSYDGIWRFDYADGSSLYGTSGSILTASGIPEVLNIDGSFVVTGGTGRFLGATGEFRELGTLDRRDPSVAIALGSFEGTLDITPVPEPAGWALSLAGLALLAALKRRER
jgi:hypothetical protein